jgi:carbon storage regulator
MDKGLGEWVFLLTRRFAMLVLTRHEGEAIVIAGSIRVTVVAIDGNRVRIGIEAPDDVSVNREEIQKRINKEE